MGHLHTAALAAILPGLVAVALSAFGLLPGLFLIGGVLLVLAAIAKVAVFAIWDGIAAPPLASRR